jgi:hypothetical protein
MRADVSLGIERAFGSGLQCSWSYLEPRVSFSSVRVGYGLLHFGADLPLLSFGRRASAGPTRPSLGEVFVRD